ncbi:MAG: DUF2726 domain-containing protein [Nitrospira sp.]|nr:DUF2726 domain-containing protein [Nitrospira sp.]
MSSFANSLVPNLIGIVAILIVISSIKSLLSSKRKGNSRFISKHPLTAPEQEFYFILSEAVPDLLILPQVAFSRFLETQGGNDKENFSLFATARQKVVDYLICDKSFNIICAIELDDRTHNRHKDSKRDAILKESGITCLRFKVNNSPP